MSYNIKLIYNYSYLIIFTYLACSSLHKSEMILAIKKGFPGI